MCSTTNLTFIKAHEGGTIIILILQLRKQGTEWVSYLSKNTQQEVVELGLELTQSGFKALTLRFLRRHKYKTEITAFWQRECRAGILCIKKWGENFPPWIFQSRNWKPVAVTGQRQYEKTENRPTSLDCPLLLLLPCSPPQRSDAAYWRNQFSTPHKLPLLPTLSLNHMSHLSDLSQPFTMAYVSLSTHPPKNKLPKEYESETSQDLFLFYFSKGSNFSENFVIFTALSDPPSPCLDNMISMPLFLQLVYHWRKEFKSIHLPHINQTDSLNSEVSGPLNQQWYQDYSYWKMT